MRYEVKYISRYEQTRVKNILSQLDLRIGETFFVNSMSACDDAYHFDDRLNLLRTNSKETCIIDSDVAVRILNGDIKIIKFKNVYKTPCTGVELLVNTKRSPIKKYTKCVVGDTELDCNLVGYYLGLSGAGSIIAYVNNERRSFKYIKIRD